MGATVLARGARMLPTDMASVTELPSPPLLRTATMSTDMSWPLDTPSASLTPVLPDLSSRGLSSIPATARGALMPMLTTVPSPLLRTATTSTAMSLLPSTPSASPIPVSADLTSRSPVSTLASTTVASTARGPLSPSTEEWLSTLDVLSHPLRGLLRVSALATDTDSTATARGPLSLSTGPQLLLRTTTTSTDMSLGLDIPSASLTLATLGLPSTSQGFTPTFCCLTAQASATKDLSYLFCMLLLPNTY